MSHIHLVKCPQCTRTFLWTPKKTVCSPACRRVRYLQRKSAHEAQWADLPLAGVPGQLAPELAGLTDPLQLLIRGNAPPGATAFRLGCFPSASRRGMFAAIRWFPFYPHRSPPVYWLSRWETPRLPCPGNYVIAYFDEALKLIEEPALRVAVPAPQLDFVWSRGDSTLAVATIKTGVAP